MGNGRLMLTAALLAGAMGGSLIVTRASGAEPAATAKPARLDMPKRAIERPTELLVGRAMPGGIPGAAIPGGFVNPKVAPGRVQWLPSFAAACDAANKSGKPVLLFQLLGKLDEQFT